MSSRQVASRYGPLLALLALAGPAPTAGADDARFKSTLSECTFLGAIQVTIEIDTAQDEPKTARLTLNDNTISFNAFGDRMATEKAVAPFPVALERLRIDDPWKLGRKLYSVRFPKGKDELLGKFALHLVWPLRPGEREGAARLVLLDQNNRVSQTLDLERDLSDDGRRNAREAKPNGPPVATYRAEWANKVVTVTASGNNPTPGWKNVLTVLPIDVYPPEFRFTQTPPGGLVPQLVTPFSVSTSAAAPTPIDHVFVIDANGRHRVAVEQVADPHAIPAEAKAALEGAGEIELLSLEPAHPQEKPADDFHGWKVLGRKVVGDETVRKELVAAFEKGVAEYTGGPAKCFNPRHGIRVKHGGKTVDFVICFECYQVRAYVGGAKEMWFLVSRSPAELFNKILKDGGVPLPKD